MFGVTLGKVRAYVNILDDILRSLEIKTGKMKVRR